MGCFYALKYTGLVRNTFPASEVSGVRSTAPNEIKLEVHQIIQMMRLSFTFVKKI